jgi:hypothetical protein
MEGAGNAVLISDTMGKASRGAVGWKWGMRLKLGENTLAIGKL